MSVDDVGAAPDRRSAPSRRAAIRGTASGQPALLLGRHPARAERAPAALEREAARARPSAPQNGGRELGEVVEELAVVRQRSIGRLPAGRGRRADVAQQQRRAPAVAAQTGRRAHDGVVDRVRHGVEEARRSTRPTGRQPRSPKPRIVQSSSGWRCLSDVAARRRSRPARATSRTWRRWRRGARDRWPRRGARRRREPPRRGTSSGRHGIQHASRRLQSACSAVHEAPAGRGGARCEGAAIGPATRRRSTTDDHRPSKLDAFVGQFVTDLGAVAHAATVVVGDKLGLYQALAEHGPATPAELAGRHRLRRAVPARVAVRPGGQRLRALRPERPVASTSTRSRPPASPTPPPCLRGRWDDRRVIHAQGRGSTSATAFRTGGGLGWHEHHEDLFDGTERFFRPGYVANLTSTWIPALDGVEDRATSTAPLVADVGCGHGASTMLLAEAYPRCTVVGFDYHEASIDMARKRAAEAGRGGPRPLRGGECAATSPARATTWSASSMRSTTWAIRSAAAAHIRRRAERRRHVAAGGAGGRRPARGQPEPRRPGVLLGVHDDLHPCIPIPGRSRLPGRAGWRRAPRGGGVGRWVHPVPPRGGDALQRGARGAPLTREGERAGCRTPPATVGPDGHRRRGHRGGAGRHRHRRGHHEVHAAAPVRAAVGRAVPLPRGEDAVVQREPGARALPLLGLPGAWRRHHLRPRGGAPRLRRLRSSCSPGGPGSRCGTRTRTRASLASDGPGSCEAVEQAVDWYHERLLSAPDAARGPQVPARARPERRRGAGLPARLGARGLGHDGEGAASCPTTWCGTPASGTSTGTAGRPMRSGGASCSRSSTPTAMRSGSAGG